MNIFATFLGFVLLIFSSASAMASTLGISDGTYAADGKLISETAWVPNLSFHSVRSFQDGVIEAHTEATLLGITVASAQARLKFVPRSDGAFDVIDLDNGSIAGSAECNGTSCSYRVTVMDGKLTLQETLIPDMLGFQLVAGQRIGETKHVFPEGRIRSYRSSSSAGIRSSSSVQAVATSEWKQRWGENAGGRRALRIICTSWA